MSGFPMGQANGRERKQEIVQVPYLGFCHPGVVALSTVGPAWLVEVIQQSQLLVCDEPSGNWK